VQIETVKLFCDVVRLGSFSRSAEIHHVTQSSASQAVHSLEKDLGVSLIDRSRRPWRLTESGRTFYDGCRDLVERYESLVGRVRRSSGSADVWVAAIYSAGLRHLQEMVDHFLKSHPGAHVHLDYLHPNRVLEAVREGAVDLGLVSFPRPGRDLEVFSWREEPMALVCPASHPWAQEKEVDPSRLDGQPFVAFDRGLVIRREVDRFLKKSRAGVHVALEFDNIEAIKQAVEIGSGVSILPEPTVDREVRAGTLAMVPLKGKRFFRPLGIVRRRGHTAPMVEEFIRCLRQNERQTSKGKVER
jgi:DNA-binding transcriptional LysR family regulator